MKLLRGKNWVELQLDKKGHKSIYIGPWAIEEKDIEGKYRYKIISFMTRRFKMRFLKDREENVWEISLGGLWTNRGTKNQYVHYTLRTLEFENVS